MSGKKLRLTCLLWPDDKPDQHSVEVELDDDETVMFLKELIKDKYTHRLARLDGRDLLLWKCTVYCDLETSNSLRFDGTDPSVERLKPIWWPLSKHFPTGVTLGTIHVIVKVPPALSALIPPALPNLAQEPEQWTAAFLENREGTPSSTSSNATIPYEFLRLKFPSPHTYHCLQTKTEVHFKYLRQIYAEKPVYIGRTNDGHRICIKFVHRYSQAAHEECAKMDFAPELRGFEEVGDAGFENSGGLTMVVMDALDKEYMPLNKNALHVNTSNQIREGLVKLHKANFVHGDVRDVNLMVREDGDPGFMLVDFDWSGVIGEVCYPDNVNKVDVWRPDDVSNGMPITSEHDMAMLEHMFSCCNMFR